MNYKFKFLWLIFHILFLFIFCNAYVNAHESAHAQIGKYLGCDDIEITQNFFLISGETTMHCDYNKVDRDLYLQLHSMNEIIGYPVSFLIIAILFVSMISVLKC